MCFLCGYKPKRPYEPPCIIYMITLGVTRFGRLSIGRRAETTERGIRCHGCTRRLVGVVVRLFGVLLRQWRFHRSMRRLRLSSSRLPNYCPSLQAQAPRISRLPAENIPTVDAPLSSGKFNVITPPIITDTTSNLGYSLLLNIEERQLLTDFCCMLDVHLHAVVL
jgi:hypothetical protein